jgi:hypothetical protein
MPKKSGVPDVNLADANRETDERETDFNHRKANDIGTH